MTASFDYSCESKRMFILKTFCRWRTYAPLTFLWPHSATRCDNKRTTNLNFPQGGLSFTNKNYRSSIPPVVTLSWQRTNPLENTCRFDQPLAICAQLQLTSQLTGRKKSWRWCFYDSISDIAHPHKKQWNGAIGGWQLGENFCRVFDQICNFRRKWDWERL